MNKRIIVGILSVSATFTVSATTVLAVNTLDFSNKAATWQKENCTQKEFEKINNRQDAAICHSLNQISKNTADISRIRSTETVATSFYRLIDKDSNIYYGGGQIATAIAPSGGEVTKLTLLNTNPSYLSIDNGYIDIKILVNGAETGLTIRLNKENPNTVRNVSLNIGEGDIISIKAVPSDSVTITNDANRMMSLTYNVGLFVQTK